MENMKIMSKPVVYTIEDTNSFDSIEFFSKLHGKCL